MADVRHFGYGSNMNVSYLKTWVSQRGGRPDGIKSATRATLKGWRVEFNGPGGKANLVEDAQGVVEGVLMEVDDATMSRLDQKDGVPREYKRLKVTVTGPEEKAFEDVIAYRATSTPAGAKPTKKYIETVVKGAESLGVSAAYLARLKGTPTSD